MKNYYNNYHGSKRSEPFIKPTDSLTIKILKILGASALFTVISVLSPQFPYVMLKLYLKQKLGSDYNKNQIHNSLKYLKQKKFIAYEFKENKLKILITKLGAHHLNKTAFDDIVIKPRAWDHRWRLLTFDIPEDKQGARQILRRKLIRLGFFHFQRSVFILPFPCGKEIHEIAHTLKIRPYMHLLTCDRFSGDKMLIKKFKLKF